MATLIRAPSRMLDPNLVEAVLRVRGESVRQLADALGVNESTVHRWRNGTSRLNRHRRQWFEMCLVTRQNHQKRRTA